MPEYVSNLDEARRAHALSEAILAGESAETTGTTVARAIVFEGYLKAEAAPAGPAIKPPLPDNASLKVISEALAPIPKPPHKSNMKSGETCLACEWTELKKQIKAVHG